MELPHHRASVRGDAPERAALAFSSRTPAVATVIVGAKSAREVEGAVEAASVVP